MDRSVSRRSLNSVDIVQPRANVAVSRLATDIRASSFEAEEAREETSELRKLVFRRTISRIMGRDCWTVTFDRESVKACFSAQFSVWRSERLSTSEIFPLSLYVSALSALSISSWAATG